MTWRRIESSLEADRGGGRQAGSSRSKWWPAAGATNQGRGDVVGGSSSGRWSRQNNPGQVTPARTLCLPVAIIVPWRPPSSLASTPAACGHFQLPSSPRPGRLRWTPGLPTLGSFSLSSAASRGAADHVREREHRERPAGAYVPARPSSVGSSVGRERRR